MQVGAARTAAALVAVVLTIAAPFVGVQPAWAAADLEATLSDLPDQVTVGSTNTATFTIENRSTGADAAGPFRVDLITVTACSDQAFPVCTPDPNPVLLVTPIPGSGTGACAGATFATTRTGGTTTITATPPAGGALLLAPPDAVPGAGPDSCSFQFSYVVQRMPTNDAAGLPGVQVAIETFAGGTALATGSTASSRDSELVTILQAQPGIVTQVVQTQPPGPQPPPAGDLTVPPGTTFTDTATVTGVANGPTPTGTVTFTVFTDPPNAAPCSGPATVLAPSNLAGPAPTPPTPPTATATSPPVTATTVGTYRFVATYSGDANYLPAGPTQCGAAGENVTVTRLTPGITTQVVQTQPPGPQPPPAGDLTVPPGTTFTDTATVTGVANGPTPTGTVTFTVFTDPPNAAPCSGPATVLAPSNLAGPAPTPPTPPTATATSPPVTATTVGTYRFVVSYSGDATYLPAGPTQCGAPGENVTVTRAAPSILTQAVQTQPPGPQPPPAGDLTVPLGTTFTDTATVTGVANGPTPTGTVTFTVFTDPPNAAPCSGPSRVFPAATLAGPAPTPPTPPTATATSPPVTANTVGTYRFVATYSGDGFYAPAGPTPCGAAGENVTVTRGTPTIATQAVQTQPPGPQPPPAGDLTVPFGTTFTDTATVTGPANGPTPTGTVTFTVFTDPPGAAPCSGPSTVFPAATLAGPAPTPPTPPTATATSPPVTATTSGTYRFVASYSGDANYAPAGPTPCGAPGENVTVGRATPILRTVAEAGVVGGEVFDTATLSGGNNPTGTITFQLYNNQTCTPPALFTSVKTLPATGDPKVVQSDRFVLPAPGVYTWVATYSGDANNNPVGPTACDDPAETVGVGRLPIAISTVASPGVGLGGGVFDTATIAGGRNPTGTITFNLYGPDDATCARPPVFTSTVPVNRGNGSYQSGTFVPTAPGTYRWVASYSGDANNASAVTACDDPLERVVIRPAPAVPTIQVVKSARPESLPVPGGTFTFDVVVTNTGPVALTIRSLTDNIYGDVTTIPGSTCNTAIGTVLQPAPGPGNTYSCSFPGDFRGPVPASQTDIVTVVGRDSQGTEVRDDDDAVVRLTAPPPGAPTITSVKTAAPPSLPEPGGLFTFTHTVTNTGPVPVTITSLTDDVYGDLNGRGNCVLGAVLAANGGTYTCSFTGNFFGNSGARQTDTITTTAVDERGQSVRSVARATVTITDVPPTIAIVKSPDPLSRPEPGGSFRFTVTVTNNSFEQVTTTALVDDIYGDLNGRGSCGVGVVLAANGGSYSCAFDGDFRGRAGDSQTDTVTVTGVDDDGTVVTAVARATVTLTPVSAPPVAPPPPPPPAPKALVRTGPDDIEGPIRLAGVMLLVGLTLVGTTWWFGDGGPGMVPVPAGPGGGGPGGGGSGGPAGGGFWFGGNRFGGARVEPPRGPFGSSGVGLLEPPARVPEAEDDDLPWDDWVGDRPPRRQPPAVGPTPAPAPDPEPRAVVPEPEPVVPDAVLPGARRSGPEPVVRRPEPEPEPVVPDAVLPVAGRPHSGRPDTRVTGVRSTGALDGAALDAARAGPFVPPPPEPPPAGGRRPRRFGGR